MRLQCLLLCLAAWSMPQSLFAQSQSTVVLGVHSVEGDDEVALAMTEALRASASNVAQWSVGPQSASLSQMMLIHSCEEPDAACLANIAAGLQVQAIVFATIRHSGLSADYTYQLSAGLYDSTANAVVGEAQESIAQDAVDPAKLRAIADSIVGKLTTPATPPPVAQSPEVSATSTLSVFAAVEGAQVYVDGKPTGAIKFGRLDLPETPVGQHQVRVEADGYPAFEAVAEVQEGIPYEVHATLTSTQGPTVMAEGDVETDTSGFRLFGKRPMELLPYALIGVGVLSAGGMIASMIVVHNAETDPKYVNYDNLVYHNDPLAEDACVRADQQHTYGGMVSAADAIRVSDLCGRADAFRVLEYVFAGIAAASTIGGVTLLVLNKRSEKPTAQGDVSLGLRPMVGGRVNGVRATLRF